MQKRFTDSAKLMKKHISCKGNARNVLSRIIIPLLFFILCLISIGRQRGLHRRTALSSANRMALRRWTIIDRNTNENGDVPNA